MDLKPGLPAAIVAAQENIVFITKDLFGNTISLTLTQWRHICKHPELRQHQEAIKRTVESPTAISESGHDEHRFLYDGHGLLTPKRNIVRVVVELQDKSIKDGSTNGSVITAYGPLRSDTGNVGKVLYFGGTNWRAK